MKNTTVGEGMGGGKQVSEVTIYSYQYHKGASQTPTQHSLHNSKTTTVQGGPRVNNARPSYQQQMHLQQSPVAAVTASCEMAGILQNINTPALC